MRVALRWVIVATTIVTFSEATSGQNIDIGKAKYQSGCASSHGVEGKGNGQVSKLSQNRPLATH